MVPLRFGAPSWGAFKHPSGLAYFTQDGAAITGTGSVSENGRYSDETVEEMDLGLEWEKAYN